MGKKTPNKRQRMHTRKLEQNAEQERGQVIGSEHSRTFTVERMDEGEDKVVYQASLSSELPVRRYFGSEILVHDADAINMERAKDGLSLLLNHDVDQHLGRVSNIRIEGDRLRGDIEFDTADPDAEKWQGKVDRGMVKDISIRYSIDDYEIIERKDEEPEYRITRWTPLEASAVTVPADHSVGFGRSNKEGNTMTQKGNEPTASDKGTAAEGGNVVSFENGRSMGKTEGVQGERERIASISEFFAASQHQGPEFDALQRDCIANGISYDATVQRWASLVNGSTTPQTPAAAPGQDQRATNVVHGQDEGEKMIEGGVRALMFRGGLIPSSKEVRDEMRGNEFASLTMGELARECLRREGIDTTGMDRIESIAQALAPSSSGRRDLVGHGTSVFSNLLANTANKALAIGYEEAPESWQNIVRIGQVPDFKSNDRPNMSAFSDLDTVVENGEYKHGTFSDKKETIQAAKKGKLFAITREALINDDLSAFTRIPRMMGIAANRSVGDAVFAILTSPPTMNEDATALFRASNTGTGGVISATTWGEMLKLMALQTDPSGNAILNIIPTLMIVPKSIEATARILAESQDDPIGNTNAKGGARTPNIYKGTFEVVSDGRLDADSAAKWYASANPNVFDTIEVAFVQGRQEPYLESRNGWSVDGIEYKVRHEFAAGPLDFRGLGYNAGA